MTFPQTPPALEIDGLGLTWGRGREAVSVLDGISLRVPAGKIVALVGESGSGKSATAMAALRLAEPEARITSGRIRIGGAEVTGLGRRALTALRGSRAGFIFQEPMTSLNPLMRIGDQIAEPLIAHRRHSRRQARARAAELLAAVGFPAPDTRLDDYPHQLSGGQRQRVMIAIAIACEPPLLIADEPTTALDVTTQAQVLALIDGTRRRTGTGVLLITHDLGVVYSIADEVCVMYAGRIVEAGRKDQIFAAPAHPYTRLLLAALPKVTVRVPRLPVIEGSPPSPRAFPSGCRFHPRCPDAALACLEAVPVLTGGAAHRVACLRSGIRESAA